MTDDKGTTRRILLRAGGGLLLGGLAGDLTACRPEPAPLADDELLEVPPALFRPTETGCTLHWIPRVELDARVVAGADPRSLETVYAGRSGRATTIVIERQSNARRLWLRLQCRRGAGEEWVEWPIGPVQLGRRPGESFRVALIADSHVVNKSTPGFKENFRATLERVAQDAPDFVVFLGDESGVNRRGMTEQTAAEGWRQWRQHSAGLLSVAPSFMVLGNHEGEAGFYRRTEREGSVHFLQRWATVARKRHFLNPGPSVYPEGGEDEAWRGEAHDPATGDGSDGNASPLENYFAFRWGDALFVVLDVHRYTNVAGSRPRSVDDWSLGVEQMRWFEQVLARSDARWKLVLAHHLVGGSEYNVSAHSKRTNYKYGRGGAKYARVGEQARITDLMVSSGAQAMLYGHDHIFSAQAAAGLQFVCCGRPTTHTREEMRWWRGRGWKEAYGDVRARNPHDFHAAIGFTRLKVSPRQVDLQYVRTAVSPGDNVRTPVGAVVHELTLS